MTQQDLEEDKATPTLHLFNTYLYLHVLPDYGIIYTTSPVPLAHPVNLNGRCRV